MSRGPCPRCKTRPRNKKSTYCKECGATKAREEYTRNPERARKRGRRWRKENHDQALAAQKRYRESPKGQEKRREYRNSPKGQAIYNAWRLSPRGKEAHKAAEKRYREKLRGLTANLPIEVVRPFATRMVKEADAEYIPGGTMSAKSKGGGYQELERLTGVPKHILWDIVNKKRLKSVGIGVADKLAMYGDFTLGELYERAQEWATLTGSPWPEGYLRRQRRKPMKKRRKQGDTKKAILRLLEEEPMTQYGLSARLGFRETSTVSKWLKPIVEEGKVESFRLPGERRRRYRLIRDTL